MAFFGIVSGIFTEKGEHVRTVCAFSFSPVNTVLTSSTNLCLLAGFLVSKGFQVANFVRNEDHSPPAPSFSRS